MIYIRGKSQSEELLAAIDTEAKLGTSSRGGHGVSALPRKATANR
jgi:hypothetical protein